VIGNLAVMPQPAGGGWAPSDQDLAALAKPGRVFLNSLLAEFEFTGIEGKLALEAAHAKGRLTAIRHVNRKAATLRQVAVSRAYQCRAQPLPHPSSQYGGWPPQVARKHEAPEDSQAPAEHNSHNAVITGAVTHCD